MDNEYPIAIFKGAVASIPFVGSFAVEILNVTIPNQRLERVEKLLRILGQKVSDLENNQLEQKFSSSDFTDVFEDAVYQSIRATSDKRLEYLASIINYGLRQEEIKYLQIKRLLKIFAEINDVEVIILESYSYIDNQERYDFRKIHSKIFHPSEIPSDKLEENEAMLKNYTSNLINLGLVGRDDFLSSDIITKLGVMLLEKIAGQTHQK